MYTEKDVITKFLLSIHKNPQVLYTEKISALDTALQATVDDQFDVEDELYFMTKYLFYTKVIEDYEKNL